MDDLDLLRPGFGPDDEPTEPRLAPVPAVEPAPRPGVHRQSSEPSRPWAWLAGLVALALVAVVGTAWLTGSVLGGPPARSPVASPDTGPLPSPEAPLPPATPASRAPTAEATTPGSSPTGQAPTATPIATMAAPLPTRPPVPTLVRVPGVVGERQGTATATLRAAGFTVSIVAAPAPSAKQTRRVLAQRPGAGQLAGRGSTVTLVVGSRP